MTMLEATQFFSHMVAGGMLIGLVWSLFFDFSGV